MVNLQVNVLNQLILLRNSTFKDPMSYLDEAVQNAQRAGATEVKVWYSPDSLTIYNNGKELDDPQKLFTIAESGWDDEVKEKENPFGVGFMSNVSVSPYITVQSGMYTVIFDVDRMLATKDTSIEVQESSFFEGFELTLKTEQSYSEVKARLTRLAAYIHEMDIYFERSLLPKKDLIDIQGVEFEVVVKEKGVLGAIHPSEYSFHNIKVFHRGRFVKEIDTPYFQGTLHLDAGVVNFTAPDRRDIIEDEKLDAFMELLNLYFGHIAMSIAVNSSDSRQCYKSLINYYSEHIDWTCIPVTVYDLANPEHLDQLKEPEQPEIVPLISVESAIPGAEHFESVDTERVDEIHLGTGGSYASASSLPESYSIEEQLLKQPKYSSVEVDSLFYMTKEAIRDHASSVKALTQFGMKLAIAFNEIEAKALRKRGLIDASQISRHIVTKVECDNPFGHEHERRAYSLLRRFNVTSAIGDLKVTKSLIDSNNEIISTLNSASDFEKEFDESKNVCVWIDRKIVPDTLTEGELDVHDYKFLIKCVNMGILPISILQSLE